MRSFIAYANIQPSTNAHLTPHPVAAPARLKHGSSKLGGSHLRMSGSLGSQLRNSWDESRDLWQSLRLSTPSPLRWVRREDSIRSSQSVSPKSPQPPVPSQPRSKLTRKSHTPPRKQFGRVFYRIAYRCVTMPIVLALILQSITVYEHAHGRRLAQKVQKNPRGSRQVLPSSADPIATGESSFTAGASFVVEDSKGHASNWPVLSEISREIVLNRAGDDDEQRKKHFAVARKLDFSAAE